MVIQNWKSSIITAENLIMCHSNITVLLELFPNQKFFFLLNTKNFN